MLSSQITRFKNLNPRFMDGVVIKGGKMDYSICFRSVRSEPNTISGWIKKNLNSILSVKMVLKPNFMWIVGLFGSIQHIFYLKKKCLFINNSEPALSRMLVWVVGLFELHRVGLSWLE